MFKATLGCSMTHGLEECSWDPERVEAEGQPGKDRTLSASDSASEDLLFL